MLKCTTEKNADNDCIPQKERKNPPEIMEGKWKSEREDRGARRKRRRRRRRRRCRGR
jgi:hypothetical protein